MSFASPKLGMPPSAMFSGALLESAQELPAVDNDTRIQRLTRLSTVGHWVAGLHAQMPVVGGVAQAILQAKEMQALFDGQAKEEEKAAAAAAALEKKDESSSVRVPIAEEKEKEGNEEEEPTPSPDAPSIELADFKTSSMSAAIGSPTPAPAAAAAAEMKGSSPGSDSSAAPVTVVVTAPSPSAAGAGATPSTPSAPAAVSSSSSSSSALTSPVASSSSTAAAAFGESPRNLSVAVPASTSPSVNRVIQFDDDYDPFTTQAGGKKIQHRDPFKLTPDDEGLAPSAGSISAEESNFLSSPTSAFAALKPTPAYTPATAEETAAMLAERAAAEKQRAASEKHGHGHGATGLFSPLNLAATKKHPLAPLQESSTPPAAAASAFGGDADTDDRAPSTPPPSATAALVSPSPQRPLGANESDLAPVEEWAAALRIQSLYRGQHIRRQLREKRLSMSTLTQANAEEYAAAAAAAAAQDARPSSQLALDDLVELDAVDPLLPAAEPSPTDAGEVQSSPAVDPHGSADLFSFDDNLLAAAVSPRAKQAQADEEVTDTDAALATTGASGSTGAPPAEDGDEPAVQDEEELNLM